MPETQSIIILFLLPELMKLSILHKCQIKVITKLPNSEQSYKGKVKTHNYINRQNIDLAAIQRPTGNA